LNAAVVMQYHFAGRNEDAITQGRRALELDASFFPTHLFLGLAYQQQGRLGEAVAELQQARALSNDNTLVTATLGAAAAAAGRRDEALAILRELEQRPEGRYVPRSAVAAVHVALGDHDHALANLESACEERCVWLPHALTVDPRFAPLRDEPRYQDLARRVSAGGWEERSR
jgi:tetratricopeptide (TPR) repeat protein